MDTSAGPRIAVVVQHHPARAHLLPALLRRLPHGAEVVADPDPDSQVRSPMRTYRACLEHLLEMKGVTHGLVIQDDAWPCARFRRRLLAAVSERPDALVVLFTPGAAAHRGNVRRAVAQGHSWTRLSPSWVPVVATVWPLALASRFLAWYAQDDPEGRMRSDDGRVGRWAAKQRVTVMAVVPSIVQHPDTEPSLIRRRHGNGRNEARVAASFVDG